jgi:hypothetical protein
MPKFRITLFDVISCVLLGIFIVVIPLVFVSRERIFYYWDFRGYQQSAINQVNNLKVSIFEPLRVTLSSLGDDYNALYTIVLTPIMLLLGDYETRATYILSLALVYFLAYLIVMGLVFASLVKQHRRAAFWTALFVTLFLPPAWLPTLRGYPDIGGALLIALATLVYIQNVRLNHWWQILLIGIFLSVAVIFRRHFGYAATAFIISALLMAVFRLFSNLKNNKTVALREFTVDGVRLGLVVLVALLLMLTAGRPFFLHVISQNFINLYSSWQVRAQVILESLGSYYGLIAVLMALSGFGFGIYKGILKPEAGFISILALIGVLQWLVFVRQVNPQYTLHFTSAIALGISTFAWLIYYYLRGKWRVVGIFLLACYFVINTGYWFGFSKMPPLRIVDQMFTRDSQPLRQSGYDETARLVKYLRSISDEGQSVFVVDSSGVMNSDMLAGAEQILYPDDPRLDILGSPQVDSRDYYPLETLLMADYIVLSTPLQRHLAIEEQGVVSTIYDAFVDQWEISRDFKMLPMHFSLDSGVETNIYKRKRETLLGTAIRTLYRIQEGVGPKPGSQFDWTGLNHFLSGVSQSEEMDYRLVSSFSYVDGELAYDYLYLGLVPTTGKIRGHISQDSDCPKIGLKLSLASAGGEIKFLGDPSISIGGEFSFLKEFNTQGWPYLILELSPLGSIPEGKKCQVVIDHLIVEEQE